MTARISPINEAEQARDEAVATCVRIELLLEQILEKLGGAA